MTFSSSATLVLNERCGAVVSSGSEVAVPLVMAGAAAAVARVLVAPGGNGLGGYNLGTSTNDQSIISAKHSVRMTIDLRSMENQWAGPDGMAESGQGMF